MLPTVSPPPPSAIPSLNHSTTTSTSSSIVPPPPGYIIESDVPPPIGCYFPNGTTDNRQTMTNKGFSPYSTTPSHNYSCSSSGYTYPLSAGNQF